MASIGPTAHYTGYVWARHGLSHPELATRQGHALYLAAEAALLPLRVLVTVLLMTPVMTYAALPWITRRMAWWLNR